MTILKIIAIVLCVAAIVVLIIGYALSKSGDIDSEEYIETYRESNNE